MLKRAGSALATAPLIAGLALSGLLLTGSAQAGAATAGAAKADSAVSTGAALAAQQNGAPVSIEAGLGFGLTPATDHLVLKLILSKDLN